MVQPLPVQPDDLFEDGDGLRPGPGLFDDAVRVLARSPHRLHQVAACPEEVTHGRGVDRASEVVAAVSGVDSVGHCLVLQGVRSPLMLY